MISLRWKVHPYKKGFYTLYVDEEPWKEIHTSLFGRRLSIPKEFVDQEELDHWYQAETEKRAKAYAYRRLGQKSFLSNQLHKALVEHAVPPSIAQQVVDACVGYGYVNDDDWVASFIRGRIRKGDGPRMIIQKLRSKGVDYAAAQEALEAEDSHENRQERIRSLLESYQRKFPPQKAIAAVIRKGYDTHAVLMEID